MPSVPLCARCTDRLFARQLTSAYHHKWTNGRIAHSPQAHPEEWSSGNRIDRTIQLIAYCRNVLLPVQTRQNDAEKYANHGSSKRHVIVLDFVGGRRDALTTLELKTMQSALCK